MPVVFTIGPEDKPECLLLYARLLASNKNLKNHVDELVIGIVEGETRVLAASLTMEEVFKERKFFKEHIMDGINSELKQFGMCVYNANVRQLQDTPGSEYFQYLRMKTQEGAINQSKIDVAEAKLRGTIGEKEREGETRIANAKVEAEAITFEAQRKIEMGKADANLQVEKAAFEIQVAVANIEASAKAALRDADLQASIEKQRANVLIAKERAEKLSKTLIEAETIQKLADANLYKAKKAAEAVLYQKEKQAEAIKAKFEAKANGVEMLQEAFTGDNNATLQYIMLQRGVFKDLAKANADAVKSMKPEIQIWSTGKDGTIKLTQVLMLGNQFVIYSNHCLHYYLSCRGKPELMLKIQSKYKTFLSLTENCGD
jgi:flotillin